MNRQPIFTSPRDRLLWQIIREIRGLYLADLAAVLKYAQALAAKRIKATAQLQQQLHHSHHDDDPHGA